MKIAIAQTEIQFEQFEYNIHHAQKLISYAASEHADYIFFPEMSFTGFTMNVPYASHLSDQTHAVMQQASKSNHIGIGYGWVNCNDNNKGENHYRIINESGMQMLDYIKIHPFSYGNEERYFQNGNKIAHATLSEIPVSVAICYDLRFPELFRISAQFVSLIIVPANWLHQRSAHWKILLQARAIENQIYILGINCCGKQCHNQFDGMSCLVNPEGKILLECKDIETLSIFEIKDDVQRFRSAFPTYRDMNIPLYQKLYKQILSK